MRIFEVQQYVPHSLSVLPRTLSINKGEAGEGKETTQRRTSREMGPGYT